MTDSIKEKLRVLLKGLEVRLDELKPTNRRFTTKNREDDGAAKTHQRKDSNDASENNKSSQTNSRSKSERSKEETEAYKIWNEKTKFLRTLYEGLEALSVLSFRVGSSPVNES